MTSQRPRGFVVVCCRPLLVDVVVVVETIDGHTNTNTLSFSYIFVVVVGGPVPVAAASPAKWLNAPVFLKFLFCTCIFVYRMCVNR